jgi:C4-dicarboxylate-specific signal transduction histidine kinase
LDCAAAFAVHELASRSVWQRRVGAEPVLYRIFALQGRARRKTFPQNTVDLIKTFAAQSAVAIENARLFKNVETSLENLRNTQDRLVQTQKLASLGQLTAGIAHEIKNPLNFVNNLSGVSVELIDELQEALTGGPLDNRGVMLSKRVRAVF